MSTPLRFISVTQNSNRSTLETLSEVCRQDTIRRFSAAVAYITSPGMDELLSQMRLVMGPVWDAAEKKWLTSFDYLRTEPAALVEAAGLPRSEVRVHAASEVLAKKCIPKVPFHPKTFILESPSSRYVLTGSGNMSRSGLKRGVEAGMLLGATKSGTPGDLKTAIEEVQVWFRALWSGATSLNEPLLKQYSQQLNHPDNLKSPSSTEDDTAPPETSRGALIASDLKKLRVCSNFWIEAGNITKNRGPSLPGNQLMMKRLSRVFFGFPADRLPPNSNVGPVSITYDGNVPKSYSLTYSDNKMDKLVLPIPGVDGPVEYDNKFIVFRRRAVRSVEMRLGTRRERTAWENKSKAVGAAFRMPSGRSWGVF